MKKIVLTTLAVWKPNIWALVVSCGIVATAFVGEVNATLIFSFTGTVTDILDSNDVLDGSVNLGDSFFGEYEFDPTKTPVSGSDSERADYEWRMLSEFQDGDFSASISVGNYSWVVSDATADPFAGIIILDDFGGFGDAYFLNLAPSQDGGPEFPVDTVRGTPNIGIQLSTTTNLGAITDTLLPTEPPLLSEFDIRSFTINGNGSQRELEIHGLITSFVLGPLPQEVPEPSTLALYATGLAGLGFMMRRRRST